MHECPNCKTQLQIDEIHKGRCPLCAANLAAMLDDLEESAGGKTVAADKLLSPESTPPESDSKEGETWEPPADSGAASHDGTKTVTTSADADAEDEDDDGDTWVPEDVERDATADTLVSDGAPVQLHADGSVSPAGDQSGEDDEEDDDDTWVPEADGDAPDGAQTASDQQSPNATLVDPRLSAGQGVDEDGADHGDTWTRDPDNPPNLPTPEQAEDFIPGATYVEPGSFDVDEDLDNEDTWVPEGSIDDNSPEATAQGGGLGGDGGATITIGPGPVLGGDEDDEDAAGGSTWLPDGGVAEAAAQEAGDDEDGGGGATIVLGPTGEPIAVNEPGADSTWIPGPIEGPQDRIDATIVMDAGIGTDGDGGQTLITSPDGDGDAAQTYVAEDLIQSGMQADAARTMADNWGDGLDPKLRPGMTVQNRQRARRKALPQAVQKQNLVIKPRRCGSTAEYDPDNDEYELIGKLGEGGMGIVYHGRQTSINRDVAIKMLKGKMAKSRDQQEKFLAEAVVTGDLDHPNIVPIYDVAVDNEGALFYSMKKVQGTPWLDVIKDKSLTENIEILLRTCDAVAFAHARGIVHRDLKPENVMLGGFGEVLVMDWGLALPTAVFKKSGSIVESTTMGGTPAYMAPEMATGPIDVVTPQSDIYLLGAMLYESITGKPPHGGKTAMQCLMAAAKNEIRPTDKSGELLDIAMRAMDTDPTKRHASVQEFQADIRSYLAHSESIAQTQRAQKDLEQAHETQVYEDFARALFGFREAYEMWEGNHEAFEGVRVARLAYATAAEEKGDFDLGISLLDEEDPTHQEMIEKLKASLAERLERQARLARYKKIGAVLVTTFMVTVTGASAWIYMLRGQALEEKRQADIAKEEAIVAQGEAEVAKVEALEQKGLADIARDEAVGAKLLADEARDEAVEAKEQERYKAYLARIGLAAAQVEENSFETARALLDQCLPLEGETDLRNWEWGRLMFLCTQYHDNYAAANKINTVALDNDRSRFLRAGLNGLVEIVPLEGDAAPISIPNINGTVYSAVFSPDGQTVAIGSDDPDGYLRVVQIDNPEQQTVFTGHTDDVLSVRYSNDGRELLSASKDNSAVLWNAASGERIQQYRGHNWWVWSAEFSENEKLIVTAGQDGIVRVWDKRTASVTPPFPGHDGPVYSAVFAMLPNDVGQEALHVVSAGYDRRLLIWDPTKLKEYDFKQIEKGGSVVPEALYRQLTGHTASIRSLAVSPERSLVVSAANDNTIKVWDLRKGRTLTTFRGHASWVRACVFSPDGRWLLSGSHDSTVKRWSVSDYEEIRVFQGRTIEGHREAILAARFGLKGQRIVTASEDRTARTWDSRTGESGAVFREGHEYLTSNVAFFPDQQRLLTAAVDSTVRAWSLTSGAELWKLEDTGRSAALALSSQTGRWIATGGTTTEAGQQWPIQVFDSRTQQRVFLLTRHNVEVTALEFSPDEKWLVSGDAKGRLHVWNVSTGEWVRTMKGHNRRVQQILFSSNGQRLFTASADSSIAQWEFDSGRELVDGVLKHPDSVVGMAISEDDTQLVSSCVDGSIRHWDLQENRLISTIKPVGSWDSVALNIQKALNQRFREWDSEKFAEHCEISLEVARAIRRADYAVLGPIAEATELLQKLADKLETTPVELRAAVINSVTASPDFKTIATVNSSDRLLEFWDLSTGNRTKLADYRLRGGMVWKADYLPDGKRVVTVGGDEARIVSAETAAEQLKLNPHAAVSSAAFSRTGEFVVTAGWDSSARVWRVDDAQSQQKLQGQHRGAVNSAIFSPDDASQFVLTAGDDRQAVLWDWRAAKAVARYGGHKGPVRQAIFSEDGTRVVTVSEDGTARVFDRETEKLLHRFRHPQGVAVLCVAISPDGQHIATGASDSLARVWDLDPAAEIEQSEPAILLEGHTAAVSSVAYAPDGKRLLTGSDDYIAKLWDTRPPADSNTANAILSLAAHSREVTSVVFSVDGRQVLTGSRDGRAIVWPSADWTTEGPAEPAPTEPENAVASRRN